MELRKLRHLVALAHRLSYSRAAADLGLSQSALTRSIQSLEKKAGMRLFDRDRSGVRLTPHGHVVLERARMLLADADDFDRHLRQTARGEAGRLGFGMAPLPAWTLLPAALSDAIASTPGLVNDVVVRNVEALWPLLLAGEIEFFVSAEGQVPDTPPVKADTLGNFPVSLLVRDGHPLLAGACPGAQFPVLLASRGGASGLPADLRDRAAGAAHVVEDYGALVALTQGTDAIWVSCAYSVTRELAAGSLRALDRREAAGPRQFRMVMYSLERRSPSPGALRLKHAFRQRIQELAALADVSHRPG